MHHAPPLRLGVNIDHVATVRNARGGFPPDPGRAALLAIKAGADGITAHLREDRRHIGDRFFVDGAGNGVYARIFGNDGQPDSDEFLVNTTTTGNQTFASVTAMAVSGN